MNTLLYVGMWEWAVNYEPQATAVELAQLGEVDDSPQCGEMSRRDKRARHPLKMEGKLPSLTKVLIR